MAKKADKIFRGSVSSSTPVHESQARFFARLIRDLVNEHSLAMRTANEGDRLPSFFSLPAYERFVQGAYACGFVCKDLGNDFPYKDVLRRPQETLLEWDFAMVRQYTHRLLREERWADGYSSPVLDALEAGALDALADRLMDDESLYGPF